MPDEEPKTEVVEEAKPDVPDESENPVEVLAKKIGWNPGHEDGDREFLSAEKFILKSKEIQNTNSQQMKAQRRKINDLTRGVADLKSFQETNYKVSVKNMKGRITELETQLTEAKEDGDTKATAKIQGQIDDINQIPDELPQTITELPPEFVEWQDKNDWYETDDGMRAYADKLGKTPEYAVMAEVDYKRFLANVEKAVKKEYPDKFKAPAKAAPPVEGAKRSGPPAKSSKNTYKDLTRDQQDTCDNFVELGIMSRAEYIEGLEDVGEVT